MDPPVSQPFSARTRLGVPTKSPSLAQEGERKKEVKMKKMQNNKMICFFEIDKNPSVYGCWRIITLVRNLTIWVRVLALKTHKILQLDIFPPFQ